MALGSEAAGRLAHVLEWIEARLDPRHCARVEARHRAALSWQPVDRLPLTIAFPQDLFEPYPYRDGFVDPQKMLINELVASSTTKPSVVSSLLIGDDFPLQVRPNFGVGVIASLFGAQIEVPEEGMPWVRPVGSADTVQLMVEAGVPDVGSALGGRVIETLEFYREALAPYSKASRHIHLTQPDLQGVLDIALLLWGTDLFVLMREQPALAHAALDLLNETYAALLRRLKPLVREEAGAGFIALHWGLCRGQLLVKEDSAIMLSPGMYAEYVRPCNERLFAEFGGGGIHFCGDGGHLRDEMTATWGLECVDMGQPELNDTGAWRRPLHDRRIALMRAHCRAEGIMACRGRWPSGVTVWTDAADVEEARELLARWEE
jgi:hypothetical protein